ncbi:hypothetical protein GCU56_18325 [Geodermatophilus sabuli]|uniref:Uncharacterized protein n=1 Tax=Geodermatophilus sabuli TaxID=1564158 RepID=A0A7K3W4K2_9ACTN|nr:hypothetical protein [Geodermatophilus sabuli]NEK59815.1 hypothetical protein [Geodermatophilus sabuli]
MEDTQHEPRVGDHTSSERQADESGAREASAAPLARLLANPRRVRRA